MRLRPEEPAVQSWESLSANDFGERLATMLPASDRRLVLIDGRSGGGKTTTADLVSRTLGGAIVHTDDIAWHLHPTEWDDALVDGVLTTWRRGEEVIYRPPGWVAQNRPGAVTVPADADVLIVEGVGAGRARLAADADLVIWVQSDVDEAYRRGIARDVELGRTQAEAETFWIEWASSEDPFLAAQAPWSRADLVVNGTSSTPGRIEVARGPLA